MRELELRGPKDSTKVAELISGRAGSRECTSPSLASSSCPIPGAPTTGQHHDQQGASLMVKWSPRQAQTGNVQNIVLSPALPAPIIK